MVDLRWYLHRLSRMSMREVGRRFLDRVHQEQWRLAVLRPSAEPARPVPFHPLPQELAHTVPAPAADALVLAADQMLEGSWRTLGVDRDDLMPVPDWFADPYTGIRAPAAPYAFSIDRRSIERVGSPKHVWELSRHHHLTVLAGAFWLTRDERYAEPVAEHLRSWWASNPFLAGIHWTSGIELGVRLISWVWVRRLLDGWDGVGGMFDQNPVFHEQLYQHQAYLARFPSHGSSANNHLVAEEAGAFVAACAFPWFESSRTWRVNAAEALADALNAQTAASGLNAELATDYHGFVLELALAAIVESHLSDCSLPEDLAATVERMLDALAAMVDTAGAPPRQGDADDGRGLLVDGPDGDRWQSLLATGAAYVEARPWWPDPGASDVRSSIWGAILSREPRRAAPPRPPDLTDLGMFIMRDAPGGSDEIWVRCDGGPHGFLATAAHAHADALSVEVRYGGVELLADPGTFSYAEAPDWRDYFRSTRAHNTVEIGMEDQASAAGPFMWHKQPTTDVLESKMAGPSLVFRARHDGYSTSRGGRAVHERTVKLSRADRTLTIEDRIRAQDQIEIRAHFHCGPAIDCVLAGAAAHLQFRDAPNRDQVRMDLPEELAWSAHKGESEPIIGWYSRAYGEREPTWTLRGAGIAEGDAVFTTTIRLPRRGGPGSSNQELVGEKPGRRVR